jgi:hypothetical protein
MFEKGVSGEKLRLFSFFSMASIFFLLQGASEQNAK